MFSLIVRNAALPDGRTGLDIACREGRIAAVERAVPGPAAREIDAGGQLVSAPFVDPHFHLDATLSLGRPRDNASGTLLEGIALWGELRAIQTADEIVERALRYCELAAVQGIGAIRSHVDVCDDRLATVEALLSVRETVRPLIDLQLVAFPQDGFYRHARAEQNLLRALDMGVDVVGGIPHFERTMADGAASVRRLCEIAAERGLPVDMHCDETDDPMSRHVETLAQEVTRLGLQGRATGSHLTSMHSMDNYYVSKLMPLMAEAGLMVVSNPPVNALIQGRHDTYPKRRGLTRVPELRAAGLTVAFGSDCMMDPWYPLGMADMLDIAFMGLHLTQMQSPEGIRACFDAVTVDAARVMGLDGYGLASGCRADFVLLQARDPVEAVRTRAARLAVVRGGAVLAESAPRVATLHAGGTARSVPLNRR